MFLAKETAAMATVHASHDRTQAPPAGWVRTIVIVCGSLPVFPCDQVVWVDRGGLNGELGGRCGYGWGAWRGLVRFEDVQAAEFLVDEGQWLESLRLENLLVEPCLHLVLLLLGKFLVGIVDVSVEL